jgi:2-succinyl-5-enolpyruvyl-6-hydroxy-3-cyclohexene-1-carboxylate synthase
MSSQLLADQIIALVSSAGVKDFFISPGSRSQALVLAAEELKQKKLANTYVRIDERSMSFTALGASLKSAKPTAMIVTSGTAVANLHPAMLEAHHAGIPLIAITADRPIRLRGKGANQTTLQPGIFDDRVVGFVDVRSIEDVLLAKEKLIGAIANNQPLQINVCFDLPLSSTSNASDFLETIEIPRNDVTMTEIDCNANGVVIAGAGGDGAREFAEAANWPLFAEPTSGARAGSQLIENYAELLNTPLAESIQKVVVFGKPTLNRSVVSLITSQSEITVVGSRYGHFDVANNAKQVQALSPKGAIDDTWLAQWKSNARTASDSREKLVSYIWEKTKMEDSVYLGASKMIRVADTVAPPKDIQVYSNRGLAGIDGSVSTAIGIAMNTSGTTRAIIGDLTAIHDLGGMNLSGVDAKNLQLWVVNDDGGKIFEQLEVKNEVSAEVFDRYFQTPQQVSFEMISRAMGWQYELIRSENEIEHVVDLRGPVLIEFRP